MRTNDDIWWALANTKVLLEPRQRLETFGTTVIHYRLIAEKMDAANQVSIREGQVHAERPQLLTPAFFQKLLLEGFGEDGQRFAGWLHDHAKDLAFLKYGFRFRRDAARETTVHDSLASVAARVRGDVEQRGEPLTAVIQGVDDAWEVCLLKFMTDTIRKAAPVHVSDMKRERMFELLDGIPRGVHADVERDFEAVGGDRSRLKLLAAKLRDLGVFEAYEDRFFALVRRLSG
ncbi:MAG: hypothetical protein IT578_10175 [Verrucomicrobiae bacterium]|nr:hypothetical protein [Verrucomicrobiae bacterium]